MADRTARERQQRRRQRRAAGAIAVHVEAPGDVQSRLILLGYLQPEHIGDRDRVALAISELLQDFGEGGGVTP